MFRVAGRNARAPAGRRGPRLDGVIIDLSRAAADALGFIHDGRTRVRLEVLRWVPVVGRPTVVLSMTALQASTPGATAEAGAPSSRGRPHQTPLFLRVYAGVGSTAGVTGVGLAGGVAARPFRRQNMEVEGDLSLFHYSNTVFAPGATANVVEFTGVEAIPRPTIAGTAANHRRHWNAHVCHRPR